MDDLAGLSLDLLKTFMVFSETGRVEETARRLGMTQAGVSLQLKKLEENIGVPLFRPLGRSKVLTDFGRDLSQSIAPPLSQLAARLKEVSRSSIPAGTRRLRVGGRPEIMRRALRVLDYPGPISFEAQTGEESWRALREDRIDGAFMVNPPDRGDFLSKKVFEDKPAFVVAEKLWNISSWVELRRERRRLLELPCATYKADPPFVKGVAAALELRWSEFDLRYICEEWSATLDLVRAGKAWSVVPGSFKEEEDNGLRWLELPPEAAQPTQFYFVYGLHLKGQKILK